MHEGLDLLLVLDDVHRRLAQDSVGPRFDSVTREALGASHVGVADAGGYVNPAIDNAYDLFDESRSLLVGELGDLAGDGGHDAARHAVLDAPLDEPFEGREVYPVVLRPWRMDDRDDA